MWVYGEGRRFRVGVWAREEVPCGCMGKGGCCVEAGAWKEVTWGPMGMGRGPVCIVALGK